MSVKQSIDPIEPVITEDPYSYSAIVSNLALGNLVFSIQAARANALAAQQSMNVLGLAVLTNTVRNLSWPLPFDWNEIPDCLIDGMDFAGKFSGRPRARKESAADPKAQATA